MPDRAATAEHTGPSRRRWTGRRRRADRLAVLTTLSAVLLVGWCLTVLPPPSTPVRPAAGGLADAAALIGYAAVFALRAPDFSVGLARRRDLAWCVGLLLGPALLGVLAGAGLWLRTGEADVVALLAAGSGLAGYANLFVAVAVFAAALTTTYSGALAIRGLTPRVPARAAMLAVAVLGGVLAVARFDRLVLPWLTLLAAAAAGAGGADGDRGRRAATRWCAAYRAGLVLGAVGAARGGLHARRGGRRSAARVGPRRGVHRALAAERPRTFGQELPRWMTHSSSRTDMSWASIHSPSKHRAWRRVPSWTKPVFSPTTRPVALSTTTRPSRSLVAPREP
ncbi:hypothetical protein JM949_35790 [Micromonospora sp. STR1s_6]|uniref:Uncharacterized protein n=1 Tax=Micromonospora tarensis TaxID=2806100 RepID=A0ABS1YRT5_9ACTN|nr:hypothetical protein [Micromonospora tarensis]